LLLWAHISSDHANDSHHSACCCSFQSPHLRSQ
jgi:hypothetical protein